MVIMGCQLPGSNQPPYPVTGEADDRIDTGSDPQNPIYPAYFDQILYYYLSIEQVNGRDDPDSGDTVIFKSSGMPAYMSLDQDTGVVSIDLDPQVSTDLITVPVSFWSEDSNGADTSAESWEVNFTFDPS